MAEEHIRRSVSPASSSGRASPVQRQPRRQYQVEDEPRRHDKTYRRYAAGIERALASFEQTREWPDYISFLGRLLKAIQAQAPATNDLPHRSIIANRLAQCLKPTLPSGVHQRALEVYAHIFSVLDKETLAADLILYLPGLAPVLTFASLSIRPLFLALIETYVLVLSSHAIRPALRSLLLSLLPGLEEENSDDFERTLRIIDGLRNAVQAGKSGHTSTLPSDSYFWQCLFFAGVSSSSRRQGLLTFLTKRLPKLGGRSSASLEDALVSGSADEPIAPAALALVTPEPGLLIRCFVAGLNDEQILVQRGFLDLLLSHLPLHSPVLLNNVNSSDMEKLVGAATTVVARRDMSLNRRLWSWLLGPHADQSHTTSDAPSLPSSPSSDSVPQVSSQQGPREYFARYASRHLVESLLHMFDNLTRHPTERAKPFRICLSLMDRNEIGSAIIPHIFVPAIQNIRLYQQSASTTDFKDLLRSANSFFDGIESRMIWQELLKVIRSSLSSSDPLSSARQDGLDVAIFVLDHFNVREEEMMNRHVPLTLLYLIASVNVREKESQVLDSVISQSMTLALQLVDIMSGRQSPNVVHTEDDYFGTVDICQTVWSIYFGHNGTMQPQELPLEPSRVDTLLLIQGQQFLVSALAHAELESMVSSRAKVLAMTLAFTASVESSEMNRMIARFRQILQDRSVTLKGSAAVPFGILLAMTQVIAQIAAISSQTLASSELLTLVADLLKCLWEYLTPSFPKYQLEAVRCMWQLDDLVSDERLVEASLAASLSANADQAVMSISSTESARRFAVLWTHTTNLHIQRRANSVWSRQANTNPDARNSIKSIEAKDYETRLYRPLLLLLDASRDADSEMGYFVRNWLESLPNVRVIFQVLLDALVESAAALPSPSTSSEETFQQNLHQDRRAELLYYLETTMSVLRISSEHMWATLIDSSNKDGRTESLTLLESLAQELMTIVQISSTIPHDDREEIDTTLERTALSLLQTLIRSPEPALLQQYHLEDALIQVLMQTVEEEADNSAIQVALLDTITASLELSVRFATTGARRRVFRRTSSLDAVKSLSRLSLNSEDKTPKDGEAQSNPALPAQLVKCVQAAIASSSSHHVLDNWISFLTGVLPLYSDAIFQNMIPLVDSFCSRIRDLLVHLDREFKGSPAKSTIAPEPAMLSLLSGLEYVVSTGHARMLADEQKKAASKLPEPSQGFFGNVVSGVFASDAQKGRTAVGNSRLTIILCFQDALKVCLALWAWGGASRQSPDVDSACAATFGYMSQRLRNKARRILDRVFLDEPLECLETLIVASNEQNQLSSNISVFSATSVLQVLDSARPKRMIPAIFNAIYTRTSPGAIDPNRASSLTSDLSDIDLGQFLVDYTQSLDADAMDEIWNDCMAFLKDVLTNPLPHNNILPLLLLFLVILGEKIEGTNFGEQRKMRKDLADSFIRLLTAMFTTRSTGMLMEAASARPALERPATSDGKTRSVKRKANASDHVNILNEVLPRLASVVNDNDRLISVISNISTNVISPVLHARVFPENLRESYLKLWLNMTRITQASKIWKKDIAEALNHAKLFSTRFELVKQGWLPIFEQLLLNDKERLPTLIGRLLAPTSAGNIFGVGASAARLEADKTTQLTLRRISLLLLSTEKDYGVSSYILLEEKLSELLTASAASSPSSATRAEVFMLIRALILKTSHIHLASLWPIVTAELQRAISSAMPRSVDYDLYNGFSLIQACKLLDLLLIVAPDDFQMHEWLFITDTIEAVYKPGQWDPVALIDDIAEELGSSEPTSAYPTTPGSELAPTMSNTQRNSGLKAPLLKVLGSGVAEASKPEIVQGVLRPWFSQLSIQAFEAMYGMCEVDWEGCEEAVLRDLFDDSTLVG